MVANDTLLDLTKPQFLSNSDNKQRFVDYLALKLANIPGIEYVKARDDADCLIIDTPLLAAAEYLRRYGSYIPATLLLLFISFYSVSGCNTTSRIFIKGKKSSSESLTLTQNTGGQLLCLKTLMCQK